MKKIYKSIKLIALLVACLAIPSLAGAQVVKNMYFNVDWQINSPFSQDFSDKTSGWGAHAEAGYYVIPNFSVGAFISYPLQRSSRKPVPALCWCAVGCKL